MTENLNGQRHDRTALVLYGSETGNSQDVAEELGRVVQRLHFITRVCDMDSVELRQLLRYTIVIFAVSTTGQGEFPKNSRLFWKSLLRKRLLPGCLSHVSFITFGLGDSSYPRFNWSARKLHKRLEQLGAKEIYPQGEADERHDDGIDGTFLAWKAGLGRHLLSTYPLPEGETPIPDNVLLPPRYLVEVIEDPEHTITPATNVKDATSDSMDINGLLAAAALAELSKIPDSDTPPHLRYSDFKHSLKRSSSMGNHTSKKIASVEGDEAKPQIEVNSQDTKADNTRPKIKLIHNRTARLDIMEVDNFTPESEDPPYTTVKLSEVETNDTQLEGYVSPYFNPKLMEVEKNHKRSKSDDRCSAVNSRGIDEASADRQDQFNKALNARGSQSRPTTTFTSTFGDETSTMLWTPKPESTVQPCPQLKVPCDDPPAYTDVDLPPTDRLPIEGLDIELISNVRLTPDEHWQDVRQLDFYVDGEYEVGPGETVTIFPKNFPKDVQTLIDLMGWNDVADTPLKFIDTVEREDSLTYKDQAYVEDQVRCVPPNLVPLRHSTLRQLLLHNLDITAIPRRHFFEIAANFTTDEMHKLRLQEFSRPEYSDEYYDYCTRPRRSILEILQDFPTVKFPYTWVASVFPVILGRKYSICSGGKLCNVRGKQLKRIQIIVAIVKYRTVLKKVRQGLASRYLASLETGTNIQVRISSENVWSPWTKASGIGILDMKEREFWASLELLARPLILVAAGTGIAPLRSLIWERAQTARRIMTRERRFELGRTYLFYGGRNRHADYFYKEDWASPDLKVTCFTAFSRDQKEKIYVQDIIKREEDLVKRLIVETNAMIFVCGSSGAMPKSVKEAFIRAVIPDRKNTAAARIGNELSVTLVDEDMTSDQQRRVDAEIRILRMENNGEYVQETW